MRFGFYDNRDNRNNRLIVNSMLSVDNNKNNFYKSKGWLPLDPTFTFVALTARAGQCIFCEKGVRVNQEQFHFGYIKLYTLLTNINTVTSNDATYKWNNITF